MLIRLSERMKGSEEGIFQILNEMKKKRLAEGRRVFDFTVGTPDFETAPYIREAVKKAAEDPDSYKYSLSDTPGLITALTDRFKRRYGVDIKPCNIASVYGSQEGIAHVAFPFCDEHDLVLAPNPGYPIFSFGPRMSGADIWQYELHESKDYVLDLADIPEDIARRARMIIVSYPLNPVCATAPGDFYRDLISWAMKYEVMVLHDNAYSDIIYDGREGASFLSFPHAMEVGAEFYSLSKSYNLTGARISFLIGNEKMIKAFKTFRSNFDYGIFYPVQAAAEAALRFGDEDVVKQCALYQERRDALCGGFRDIGWDIPDSKGSMFAWGPLAEGYASSRDFVLELFDRTGVLCTPGVSFGSLGEGHVRFALNHPVEEIKSAIDAVRGCGVFRASGQQISRRE